MQSTLDFEKSFACAIDCEWMKKRFSVHARKPPEERWQIRRMAIQHIRHKSKFISIVYEVEFSRDGADSHTQLYVGNMLTKKPVSKEMAALAKRPVIEPRFGRAIFQIPEINMVVAAYPNDRKMVLMTGDDLQQWIPRHRHKLVNGAEAGARWRFDEPRVDVLRYVPEKRFTARCRFRWRGEEAAVREGSFILKQLNDRKKASRHYRLLVGLHKAIDALARAEEKGNGDGRRDLGCLRIPHPLGLHREKPVFFLEDIPGRSLDELLDTISIPETMHEVGRTLAAFHRIEKRVRKQVTFRNELAEVRAAMKKIESVMGAIPPALITFYRELRAFRWRDAGPKVLLHGSFRLNHIFLHEKQLALLDLESLRVGHPAYDVANFLATLYYFEAQSRIRGDERVAIMRYFLDGYDCSLPVQFSARAVFWFLASLLINKQAYKYVAHSHEDHEEKVRQMISLAGGILGQGNRCRDDERLGKLWAMLP